MPLQCRDPKLHCKYELRRNYFSHRIVPICNSLPDSVVSAESVNSFKSRLDSWSMHDFLYDYRAESTWCLKSSVIVIL